MHHDGPTYDMAALDRDQFTLWLDGYEWGVVHGIAMGRQQADDEHQGTWPLSAAVARHVAQRGPWADLSARRGEHEAAQAARDLLVARGIVPGLARVDLTPPSRHVCPLPTVAEALASWEPAEVVP